MFGSRKYNFATIAMPRVYFTLVISGTAWVSLGFLLVFIHNENRHVLDGIQHAIVAEVSPNDHDHNAASRQRARIHQHVAAAKRRESSNSQDDLDPILGRLDKDIPRFGPGELGEPVYLSGEAVDRAKRNHNLHNFNLVVSDKISLERSLEDTRDIRCQDITYKFSKFPTASVIIAFHNEAWSTLMRTVHSVVNRTPSHVLAEIILVDDASSDKDLQNKLENIPALVRDKVRLFHSDEREGVARARIRGAREARGEVLVFLDSHCEVNTHWLEPMLEHINQSPSTVVSPVLDSIDPETFAYQAGQLSRSTFSWSLELRRVPLTKVEIADRENPLDPVRSPQTNGGIFAVNKSFFQRIGGLDPGMEGWGGESLDFSFKAWMCGGSIYIVPCSRVGHVSRETPPYTYPGSLESAFQRNMVRVAEMWMDDYRDEFYDAVGLKDDKDRYYSDISEVRNMRMNLNCFNFDWYLSHVVPLLMATAKNERRAWGQIRNAYKNLCINAPSSGEGKRFNVEKCDISSETQMLLQTKDFEIRFEDMCLDLSVYRMGAQATLEQCNGLGTTQEWEHSKWGQLRHTESGYCLDIAAGTVYRAQLLTNDCSDHPSQKWAFSYYTESEHPKLL